MNLQSSLSAVKTVRFRRLSKEGVWIILGQAMAVSGSLVGIRLLTELLPPEQYGQLALGMTIATLVQQILFGPISQGAMRFYAPAQEAGDIQSYFFAVGQLAVKAGGGVGLITIFAAVALLTVGQIHWLGLGAATLCFALFAGVNGVFNGIQNAARQRPVVAMHQGLAAWGRFLAAAGLLVWMGANSAIAMLGYSMAMSLVVISQFFFVRRINRYSGNPEDAVTTKSQQWTANILSYSWPFTTWVVFTSVQQISDRWALEMFSNTQEVGLYAVLFQFGFYPITIVTNMAIQLFAPILFQRSGDASDHQRIIAAGRLTWRISSVALLVTGCAFLTALFFHGPIFKVFVAAKYQHVSNLLPWLVLSGGVFATGQNLSIGVMSKMESRRLIAPKVCTSLIGIGLNLAGAYTLGLYGVVMASLSFSILYLFWISLFQLKTDPKVCGKF